MGSEAKLILVRYAAIDCCLNGEPRLCGLLGLGLSQKGESQIQQLRAKLLLEPPVAAVYSSPLHRAVQTAQSAPDALRKHMLVLKSLAEIDCGDFEVLPIAYIRQRHAELWLSNGM